MPPELPAPTRRFGVVMVTAVGAAEVPIAKLPLPLTKTCCFAIRSRERNPVTLLEPPPRSISFAAKTSAPVVAAATDGVPVPELRNVIVPAAAMVTSVPLPVREDVSSVRFCNDVPSPKWIEQPVAQPPWFLKLWKLIPPDSACRLSEFDTASCASTSCETAKPLLPFGTLSPMVKLLAASATDPAPMMALELILMPSVLAVALTTTDCGCAEPAVGALPTRAPDSMLTTPALTGSGSTNDTLFVNVTVTGPDGTLRRVTVTPGAFDTSRSAPAPFRDA